VSLAVPDPPVERVTNLPLGYLRGFIVLLVVAYHSALAYTGILAQVSFFEAPPLLWRAFPIVDRHSSPLSPAFIGFNDAFFMSLMFLLSGLFVAPSISRKGPLPFLRDRALRLGIPYLFAAGLLGPLAYFPAFMQITGTHDVGRFLREWLSLGVWPSGPAWFIALLLVFDLLATVLFATVPRSATTLGRLATIGGTRPFRFFLVVVLLSLSAYVPLSIAYGPWSWMELGPFTVQTSRVAHYTLYFLLGVGLGRAGADQGLLDPAGTLAGTWWIWVLVALVAFVLAHTIAIGALAAGGQPPIQWNVLGGIGFSLSCGAACFACLAVSLRFVKRQSHPLNSLLRNSYGIYLVHYPFVNWLLFAMLAAPLPAVVKFLIVFSSAVLLSGLTASLLTRNRAIARIL